MLYVISKIRGKLSSKARKGPGSASERAKTSGAPASTALTTITTEATKHTEAIETNSLSWDFLNCTDYLWDRAYILVQGREPELMEEYRHQIVVVHQGDGQAAGTDLTCRKSVESLVNHLLDYREKRRWRISLLGKDITLRRQVERLTKFLIWSDPIVKTAVCTQPYAALAWSGVSAFIAVRAVYLLLEYLLILDSFFQAGRRRMEPCLRASITPLIFRYTGRCAKKAISRQKVIKRTTFHLSSRLPNCIRTSLNTRLGLSATYLALRKPARGEA